MHDLNDLENGKISFLNSQDKNTIQSEIFRLRIYKINKDGK